MLAAWLLITPCCLLAPMPPAPVVNFVQVAPYLPAGNVLQRHPYHTRAVVLLHGLRPHVISASEVERGDYCSWERPDSTLVQLLAADSDVFAVGYAQTGTVDDVARAPALREGVATLRRLGFTEVVLVGHSAGGVVARQFVEDQPNGGGVTRVVQVCSPNGGCNWGKFCDAVRTNQAAFVRSLSKHERAEWVKSRTGVRVPDGVEFVSIVGVLGPLGDGVVPYCGQWPPDLQEQGIPAVRLITPHMAAMMIPHGVKQIAEASKSSWPRWEKSDVDAMRKKLGLRAVE